MKKLFPLLFLISNICHAQNWQCLQFGVKHYFTNANGYLRGIRIDSVKTAGSDVVYYPFHTPRGSYDVLPLMPYVYLPLDSTGGSWLSKVVIQQTDGTFIFDSFWGDSVVIKTQAHVGDSWVLYSDTSSLYYTGTITSQDTMTVSSILDSIKTITINARNPSGIVTSDPLNGITITLSKNNGFVEVCDLYTFPYHKPDSSYRLGLDFYLDRSMCVPYNINGNPAFSSLPLHGVILFKLTDFINPTEQQLHAWDVGDVVYWKKSEGLLYIDNKWALDTVVLKVISGHFAHYNFNGSLYHCPVSFPCSLSFTSVSYSFSDEVYPIFDTLHMPEEVSYTGKYVFYYHKDSSYCSHAPAYTIVPSRYNPGLGWVHSITSFKLGIGKTFYEYADGNPVNETERLLYYNIDGIPCGTPPPTSVKDMELNNSISLSPNPTTHTLIVSSSEKITQLTISDLLGHTIYNNTFNTDKAEIDVSSLPAGIYLIRINYSIIRKFVKE